jgi:FdhE protein
MKSAVVSSEYLRLQEEILKMQVRWKSQVDFDSLDLEYDQAQIEAGVPLIVSATFHIDYSLFLQWVNELKQLLIDSQEDLKGPLNRVVELLDEETVEIWTEEALLNNVIYFANFANEHKIDEWIPHYLAETVIRPYLQLLGEKTQNYIKGAKPGCGCPVCGEPVRLGQLEEKGQKILYCPRCQVNWPEKKLSCSHCGNVDSETMKYITIEGRPSEQIHVCEECKGYTKIIDTRQFIEKPSPQLLDIQTIHLDYIAQEKGYMVMGEKKQVD